MSSVKEDGDPFRPFDSDRKAVDEAMQRIEAAVRELAIADLRPLGDLLTLEEHLARLHGLYERHAISAWRDGNVWQDELFNWYGGCA